MHQIHFLLGLCSIPLPLFKGPTSKGMEGKGRGGRKGKGEGRGEAEGGIWPTKTFWCGAPYGLDPAVKKIDIDWLIDWIPAAPNSLQSAGLVTNTNIEHTSTQLIVESNTGIMASQDVRWDQVSFAVWLMKLCRRQHVPAIRYTVNTIVFTLSRLLTSKLSNFVSHTFGFYSDFSGGLELYLFYRMFFILILLLKSTNVLWIRNWRTLLCMHKSAATWWVDTKWLPGAFAAAYAMQLLIYSLWTASVC